MYVCMYVCISVCILYRLEIPWVQAIVDMKAHLEAETVYYGRPGHRPLTIACSEGRLAEDADRG